MMLPWRRFDLWEFLLDQLVGRPYRAAKRQLPSATHRVALSICGGFPRFREVARHFLAHQH